jgi:iron complex outermembrane receptor protein
VIGLGYSAYDGSRTITAVYTEVLLPIVKTLEASGAIRYDHYSDAGNSTTPKVGVKWTPASFVALRGTYAKGFRAPNPAENGRGGLAFFTTAADPLRCNLGVATACDPANVAGITSPNPDLRPEKSTSYTLGILLEPTPTTSLALDYFQIKRKNEINQENTDAAIAAGHVARDPTTASVPGDPGAITAVLINYVNSAQTKVNGLDLDFKQRFDLGASGKLLFNATWTHLFKWLRTEQDGSQRDFAGTHGNCDVTNCIGTPDDRVNLDLTFETGPFSVTTTVNYRGPLDNKFFKDDPAGCATVFADGTDAPNGCKIGSFTTFDLTGRWQVLPKLQLFGGIRNLFDRKPPVDPTTYGAVSYNPLDYSGAVGRFFSVGGKYTF